MINRRIAIIGSDSFIATKFYNTCSDKQTLKLFSRQASGKQHEIIKDLFEITCEDFKDVDIILNFAAIVHQPKLKDDALYKKINTALPIQLAKQAKKAGVKHFIQMSTIAVYGEVEFIDSNTPENPNNLYGSSKLAADTELLAMQDENFKVTLVRPPMVYGGGKAPGNLQSLINVAQKGIPLPFKAIKNQRDFIHVKNLVSALMAIVENNIFGVVIPTDRQSVSTEQIINLIKIYSDKKVRLVKVPGFIHTLIKRIKPKLYSKVFGDLRVQCNLSSEIYNPEYSLEDGINEMINEAQIN